ncbi:MAG: asparagine synthase [Candidatus Helarchaeota archaeon]|nr:asparagine synthase [Candidatus Helarchaeota archaeon]
MKGLLDKTVKKNASDGILLSGGLDTSIIATIASKFMSLKAVTVGFQNAPAPDIKYAALMAKKLGFEHAVHIFDQDELIDALPTVIKETKSFDPMEIRNSVVIYIGLKVAKKNGIRSVLTGDGADELFAGYSFLFGFEKEKLDLELKKLSDIMMFSSIPLANMLGMEAKAPFLDLEVKKFALSLDSHLKVHKENGKIHGKWILRKCYERILPKIITWRIKIPIEVGSGTTTLPNFFNQKISDSKFHEARNKYYNEDSVSIRDKEHLFYYEIYRSTLGIPHPVSMDGKVCPRCNSDVSKRATYCRTCGAYPI